MSKVKRGQVQSKTWWALVRAPHALPVLFSSRKAAIENADPDERIVRVDVCAYSVNDAAPRNGDSGRVRPRSRNN